jgi:hypothetical protein
MNRRTITACALALGFLAVSGRVALAQDRDHGQNNDNGQHNENWNRDHHTTFNDQDRQATRSWYQQHQNHLGAGWRQQDRLTPEMEGHLRAGSRLDPRLRRQLHWLPNDLSRQYGAAPRGYRYGIIGGNVVMLDDEYQVRDVFRLDFQGR